MSGSRCWTGRTESLSGERDTAQGGDRFPPACPATPLRSRGVLGALRSSHPDPPPPRRRRHRPRPPRPSASSSAPGAPRHCSTLFRAWGAGSPRSLEVRLKPVQKPYHFEIAGLGLQTTTRTDTVQVPVDVKLQEVRRVVARQRRPVGRYPLEAGPLEVSPAMKASTKRTGLFAPTQSSTASGRSSNCERSSPEMCVMSPTYQTRPLPLMGRRVFTRYEPKMSHLWPSSMWEIFE